MSDGAQKAADAVDAIGAVAGKIPVYGAYAQIVTTAVSTGIRVGDKLSGESEEQRKARLAANEKFQKMANDSAPPSGALPRKANAMGDDDEKTSDDETTLESEGGVFVGQSGKAQGDRYRPSADESDDESDASDEKSDESDVTDDAPKAKAKAADGPDVTKAAPKSDDAAAPARSTASRSDLMRHLQAAAASLAKAIEAAEGTQVAPPGSNAPQNAAQSVSGPAPMTGGTGEVLAAVVNPFVKLMGAAIDRQGR